MKSNMLVRFELSPPEIYCYEHDVRASKYMLTRSRRRSAIRPLCSLPEWAADVSALIVPHGHDSNSSDALTLKV